MNPIRKIMTIYYKIRNIEYCVVCGHRKEDHEQHEVLVIYKTHDETDYVRGKCTKCDCKSFVSSKEEKELEARIRNDLEKR